MNLVTGSKTLKNVRRVWSFLGLKGFMAASANEARMKWIRLTGRRYFRRKIYDYEMHLNVRDPGISRTLTLFGFRELEHRKILKWLLRPGMTVLDIGANLGYYTIMMARWVAPGRVIAIEPAAQNVGLLKKNIAVNKLTNVDVISAAISDRSGNRNFYLSTMSNLNTFHPAGSAHSHLTGQVVPVQTLTIAQIMEGHGQLDLIRMDVEGHEVEIIRSLLPDIMAKRMAPMILFEIHRKRYGKDHDMEPVLKGLFDCGYVVPYVGSSNEQGTRIIEQRGYKGIFTIKTDFMIRTIFENIKPKDAIDFICYTGGVRTTLLAPRSM